MTTTEEPWRWDSSDSTGGNAMRFITAHYLELVVAFAVMGRSVQTTLGIFCEGRVQI